MAWRMGFRRGFGRGRGFGRWMGPWPGRGPFSNMPPWQRPGWLFGRGSCWRLFNPYLLAAYGGSTFGPRISYGGYPSPYQTPYSYGGNYPPYSYAW